jgi:hypothetical protein
MKAVLLTGAGVAVVDGVVLGVALGVGSTAVAATALAVGLVSAFVVGWMTPTAPVPERSLVTLGTRPTPQPEQPQADEQPIALPASVPLPAPTTADVAPAQAAPHALPTPAAA